MNHQSDIFINNLYNHINSNQNYHIYNTSSISNSQSHIQKYIYDKISHDIQYYST